MTTPSSPFDRLSQECREYFGLISHPHRFPFIIIRVYEDESTERIEETMTLMHTHLGGDAFHVHEQEWLELAGSLASGIPPEDNPPFTMNDWPKFTHWYDDYGKEYFPLAGRIPTSQ